MLYRLLVRPLLYALSAETAHRCVMWWMRLLQRVPALRGLLSRLHAAPDPVLRVHALGLDFPTPIGLAAGLDKDAEAFEAFGALGFGFVEVGTLTAEAQPGNPRPRLFRLVRDRALINRMGFNNHGAAAAAARLASAGPRNTLLGINIGKTKRVPNDQAIADYVASARLVAAHADYLVINVSSPNTPGLRDLQAVEALRPLLRQVRSTLDEVSPARRVPLLLKIAPDLSDEDLDAVADLALELSLDGLIATNTTITRTGLRSAADEVQALGAGGLSGAPLKQRSLRVLRRLRERVGDRVLLMAAGGIETADDAWERICSGATLVQIYTALIYDGPGLPARLSAELARKVRAEGLQTIAAAIGRDVS
ncbi:MAG TPA: quinone-dependent dihydroorotate dehydrogenase [Polyangiales bacterium]